jgi:hypothetical protein
VIASVALVAALLALVFVVLLLWAVNNLADELLQHWQHHQKHEDRR